MPSPRVVMMTQAGRLPLRDALRGATAHLYHRGRRLRCRDWLAVLAQAFDVELDGLSHFL